MPGLYIHIPFCLRACCYCDFHFKARLDRKDEMVSAMSHEIETRLTGAASVFDTLYIGGGTPTVLSPDNWEMLMETCRAHAVWKGEFTVEANPEDLTPAYLQMLKDLGVNRLSIGIQSFDDDVLQWMHRRHSARCAMDAVADAQTCGFDNLNIDLMYGIPGMSLSMWERQLQEAVRLRPAHLSAYHLTIEPQTIFGVQQRKGLLAPVDEQDSLAQYQLLAKYMKDAGYQHYEISNFSLPGCEAVHNSAYWKQQPYAGFGPSAHSFTGSTRRWNVASNNRYMHGVMAGTDDWFEEEQLSERDRYNEFVMLSLRTAWGVRTDRLESIFPKKYLAFFRQGIQKYLDGGQMIPCGPDAFRIAEPAWMIADSIISDLFMV